MAEDAMAGSAMAEVGEFRCTLPPSPSRPETASPPGSTAPSTTPEYRIGPYDEIDITVRGHPDVSSNVRVRPDGYASIPPLGDLRAVDCTPSELRREVQRQLADYLVAPEVTVEVEATPESTGRQVRIIGETLAPRAVPHRAGMTILDLLTETEGLSPFADGNAAELIRRSGAGTARVPLRLDDLVDLGDLSANVPVAPGDVVVVPRGFFAGDWHSTAAVDVTETYTDNVGLDPDGQRDPALITGVTPRISFAGTGARISGALSAAVTGQYQTLSHSGPSALFDVLGTSTTELRRDSVFLDAAASISEQPLSTTAATSGAEGNNTNLTTVQTYSLSPRVVGRLSDVADIDARALFGATLTGDTGGESRGTGTGSNTDASETLSDSVTSGAVVTLGSPRDVAPRVQLRQTSYVQRTTRFGASDVTSAGASLTPTLAVRPGLALLAIGGYDILDDGGRTLQGPSVAAGFRYEPTPSFSWDATAGWRLENPEADVSLRWDIGPRTKLGVRYQETVSVGQSSLQQNLSSLAYDPIEGRLVDQNTGFAFAQVQSGLDISNELTRTQRGTVILRHERDVDTFGLDLYATRQKAIDGSDRNDDGGDGFTDQKSVGGAVSWGRRVSRSTGISTGVSLTYTDSNGTPRVGGNNRDSAAATGKFETFAARITLSHDWTERLSSYVGYRFQRRFASDSENEFTENAVLVGLSRRF